MAKFNRFGVRRAASSPVKTASTRSGRTFEGAPGYARDAKSELFLLAVANMVGEDTFYERAKDRDDRFTALVRQLAVDDADWTARLLAWLRTDANMRSASLVGAAEYVKARLDAAGSREHRTRDAGDGPGAKTANRRVIDSVLQRADEPGEMLAYWTSTHGRNIPKPVKRGVADAISRLYTERALLKYDSGSHGFRFGDVIDLVHPTPGRHNEAWRQWQGDLFEHALDRRHNRDDPVPDSLRMLHARAELMSVPVGERRAVLLGEDGPARLQAAGMTWETLAGWSQGPMDSAAWEAIIPSMGYMACLAEGTPVWLADGTTAPIEAVVARRLPVLSYDKAWDTRPVRRGRGQGPRTVGTLVPTTPSAWLDTGTRPVAAISFASGRVIAATYDHRWVRRAGRHAWEWTTTGELRVGDRIPVPLTAGGFGDEGDAWDGYFVGAMLGDGGTAALTPEFRGDPDDGAVAFMREYAAKHGCVVRENTDGTAVRLRFPARRPMLDLITETLRRYRIRGKRCEVTALPNRPFSREFWIGVLSGLLDTDGRVRERIARGTPRGSVEYATVSRRLAEQLSDVLLRLGVTSVVREKSAGTRPGVRNRHPIFIVEVTRATALVRLAALLDLRIGHKAARLAGLADRLAGVAPAAAETYGHGDAVALDRIVAIEDAGERATYCVTVDASNLFVANGVVTGNCLRNLRNFDEAGVSDAVAEKVAVKLADRQEVARSRQFPFRFLAAYNAAPSLRWSWALEKALGASLSNVPSLPGRTLVLVDRSGSMFGGVSRRSGLNRADSAAIFGAALAVRAESADLVEFGTGHRRIRVNAGMSVLAVLKEFTSMGGTNTAEAVRANFRRHDRVVIVTDEQAWGGYGGADPLDQVPANVPVYTWNLAGYEYGHGPSGGDRRHTFGGLTDAAFRMVPLIEAGNDQRWNDIFEND
jgi:hypothetical protein